MSVSKSLWARYIEELRDTRFIEKEWGFISYSIMENCIYLEDVYVIPERRREKLAVQLVEEAEAIGVLAGKTWSMAVIQMDNNFHDESLQAHLQVGFKSYLCENNKIWLKRPIPHKGT